MLQVDRVRAIPARRARIISHVLINFATRDSHILVDRVPLVAVPVCLDGPNASIRTDVTSEATTGNHLAQAVDVSAVRECRGDLCPCIST